MNDIEKAIQTIKDTNPMPSEPVIQATGSKQPVVVLPESGEIPTPELLSAAEHTEAHGDVVKGYRKLSTAQTDAMNELKVLENQVGRAIIKLQGTTEFPLDNRFISIGRTNLQQGFMALVRSIAQPESEL